MKLLTFASISVFFLGFSSAAPVPYVCSSNTVVSPPTNIDQPYFYPNNWSDDQAVPQYLPGQICRWVVTVPQGYYARVVLQGKAQSDTYFQIIDSAQHYEMTGVGSPNIKYYYPTQFTIVLNSGSNYGPGTFAFKIEWAKLPVLRPNSYSVASGSAPLVSRTTNTILGAVVYAETQVSVVPVAGRTGSFNDLRGILIFDGPYYKSKFVGNLHDVYISSKQFVSTGKQVYLVNVNTGPSSENYFVAQDFTNTKQFNQYSGIACVSKTDCPVVLNGEDGPAGAIAVFEGNEILNSANLADTTTLKVYSGVAKDHNLLAQYDEKTVDEKLPQKFNGVMRQYTIDTGRAVLHLTRN